MDKHYLHKKKIAIYGLAILLVVILSVVFAASQTIDPATKINNWNNVKKSLSERNILINQPAFTNIVAVPYYTPSLKDFNNNWCSPKKKACFKDVQDIKTFYKDNNEVKNCIDNQKQGFCCIPEEDRGFYEEVKCKGEGVADSKVYADASILPDGPTKGFLDTKKYTSGITYQKTNPEPKRTLAINMRADANCYLRPWDNVYLYFGEDNPWNGVYLAEDSLKTTAGDCQIGIFTGVGKDTSTVVKQFLVGTPKVYVLDNTGDVILNVNTRGTSTQNTEGYTPIVGTLQSSYSTSVSVKNVNPLFSFTQTAVKKALDSCSKETTIAAKRKCFTDNIQKENSASTVIINNNCKEGVLLYNNLSTVIKDKVALVNFSGVIDRKDPVTNVIDGKNNYDKIPVHIKDSIKDSEKMKFYLRDDAVESGKEINPGDYITVLNAKLDKNGERYVDTKEQITLNSNASKLAAIKYVANQISDLSTSKDDCSESIDIPRNLDEINFDNGLLTFKDYTSGSYVDITSIIPNENDADIKFSVKNDGKPVFFSKNSKTFTVTKIDPKLVKCAPRANYLLMCSELKSETTKGGYVSDHDILRFTVKIE